MNNLTELIKNRWKYISECCYLLILAGYLFERIINTSVITLDVFYSGANVIFNYVDYFFIPVALIGLWFADAIVSRRYEQWKNILFDVLVFIPFAIAYFHTKQHLAIGAFIVCSKFSSPKKIASVAAAGIALTTVLVIIASVTPGMEWFAWDTIYIERFGLQAHNFGFWYYAIWARQILFAAVYYIYARNKKITLVEIAIVAFVLYQTFIYSTQRLNLVVSIIAILLCLVIVKFEIIKINNKLVKSLSALSFPVASVMMIGLHWFYNEGNSVMVKLNSFINGRLLVGRQAFDLLKINLFGQRVEYTQNPYFYIDCGYMQVLFESGIVLLVAMVLAMSYVMWRACEKNDTPMFMWMTVLLIYMAIDNAIFDMTCCGIALLVVIPVLNEHISEIKSRKQGLTGQ